MEQEIVVRKNGKITIPAKIRKQLNIVEGTVFKLEITDEGLLLRLKK